MHINNMTESIRIDELLQDSRLVQPAWEHLKQVMQGHVDSLI